MKPFYSIQELADMLNEPIYKVADSLVGCGVAPIHEGKPADFSGWDQLRSTPGRRSMTILRGGVPTPDPSYVVVNADNLPQTWKEFIDAQKVKEPLTQSDTASHSNNDPWLIQNPNDPPPLQPWYTPARYFARKLIMDDSTLLTKKKLLAAKVSISLADIGFFKRGKIKKKFDAGTVLKAFSNVSF